MQVLTQASVCEINEMVQMIIDYDMTSQLISSVLTWYNTNWKMQLQL